MESPIHYLNAMGWRVLHYLVLVVHFLKILWVILLKLRLFLDLLAILIFVAYHGLPLFIVLCSSSLRAGCKVIFIGVRWLRTKVLSPVSSFLKHLLLLLLAWLLIFFFTALHQAHIFSLRLWKHLRYLRHRPTVALVTMAQWSYYGFIFYCQENAYQVIWQALKYQMLYILLLGCLDGLWAAVYKVTQLILAMELPGQEPLEAIVSSLPPTIVPLSQRFPGSYPSIPAELYLSYRPLTVKVNVEDGTRSCSFSPFTRSLKITRSCPCRCQHQHHVKQRRVGGLLPPSRNTVTQMIKNICVTLIIFFYFGDMIYAKIKK